MKKTMFITSVIMVVVMAIALTTSSLAWFSAAGTATVTTNKLAISAKATTSSGLQISSSANNTGWAKSINLLESGDTTSNVQMIPADLVKSGTVADYDTATVGTHNVATVLDALVGNKFISNDIDSDQNFSGTAVEANVAGNYNLYFAKDFWISSVATAQKYVRVSCKFYKYANSEYVEYTGNEVNTNDPNLYVAVLGAKKDAVKADRSAIDGYSDWEIMAIFSSQSQASVMLGDSATAYESGHAIAQRGTEYQIETANSITGLVVNATHTNSVALDPITTNAAGEQQSFGSSRQYKVVAWYEGASLNNTNSTGNYTLYFDLTFQAKNSTTGD